jgi:hypothetical protein
MSLRNLERALALGPGDAGSGLLPYSMSSQLRSGDVSRNLSTTASRLSIRPPRWRMTTNLLLLPRVAKVAGMAQLEAGSEASTPPMGLSVEEAELVLCLAVHGALVRPVESSPIAVMTRWCRDLALAERLG